MKYDIAIIGGGPAGLSAAITASSKGRKVVVFEAHGFSPRLRSVELITDYGQVHLACTPYRCGDYRRKNSFIKRESRLF